MGFFRFENGLLQTLRLIAKAPLIKVKRRQQDANIFSKLLRHFLTYAFMSNLQSLQRRHSKSRKSLRENASFWLRKRGTRQSILKQIRYGRLLANDCARWPFALEYFKLISSLSNSTLLRSAFPPRECSSMDDLFSTVFQLARGTIRSTFSNRVSLLFDYGTRQNKRRPWSESAFLQLKKYYLAK